MRRTVCCKSCRAEIISDPRLKGKQKYCGKAACQNARKRAWDTTKCKKDTLYHEKRLASKKNWRKNHPANEYQSNYRSAHPKYVEENRKKQALRNKKRLSTIASTVINPYSLIVQLKKDGDCSVSRVKKCLVIKSDALSFEVTDHQ